jgi:single-strand DNA-binding protein
MNKITLIGNLTHDPEVRSTPNGVTVCSFTIAVNRRFAGANGERPTDFFRINAWRQLGETCARFLSKGRKVAVIGELQARTYEAKDGSTRMSLDVQADEVEFLSPKQAEDGSAPAPRTDNAQDMAGFTDIQSDDIPF